MNKLIVLMLSVAVLFSGWQFFQKMKGEPEIMKNDTTQADEYNTSGSGAVAGSTPAPTGAADTGKPPMTISTSATYAALIKTDKGDMTVSLYAKETPVTVNNFVVLARRGFYDNTVFHRVINGFMIQGGDPKGDGTGGPGYRFDDEPFTGEYTRGTVAMANAGPNTNGSQFFIMHSDYPLPKNYVIFGKVTKGLEVIDAIATAPVKTGSSGEESSPVTPVKVTKVEILEN